MSAGGNDPALGASCDHGCSGPDRTISVITCPHCGAAHAERMPTDACQYFYECPACRRLLRPKPGDCCVFCSYGTVPCPPVQAARG
jgi:hypothetical protein